MTKILVKKILIVTVVSIAIVSCWGCEKKETVENKSKDVETVSEEEDKESKQDLTETEKELTEEVKTEEPEEDQKVDTGKRINNYLRSAHQFSEGKDWVLEDNDISHWKCIDKEGNILFELPEDEEPTTDFKNGIAIVDKKKVINAEGKVISSVDDGKYTEILSDEFNFEGYVFVNVYENTIEGTSEKIGIIDNQGEWYQSPDECRFQSTKIESLEDGIYKTFDDDFQYYDAIENEYIDLQEVVKRKYKRRLKEGLIFVQPNNESDASFNYFKGDMGLEYDLADTLGIHTNTVGFYDEQGNLVIDLSGFAGAADLSGFQDGYCAIELKNPQENHFITIIDKTGQQLFEPIDVMEYKFVGFSQGIICRGGKENGLYTYVDLEGNVILEDISSPGWVGDTFNEEGLLKVGNGYPAEEVVFYNKQGEKVF